MLILRQTVFLEDYSFIGMQIVGSEVRQGLYRTRLGETRRRGPFDSAHWVRPVGEACLVMIDWVRPSGNWLEKGIGSHLEWEDSMVSG